MEKKLTKNDTPGRGNYSSVKHEIKIAIWYLTKENTIDRIMVQGKEDLVAESMDGKKHLIQVKETTKAKQRFSEKRIDEALVKLDSKNTEDVEVLAIASNTHVVMSEASRTLIEEKFDHPKNKAIPGFQKYKDFLENKIDIKKFHLIKADFESISKITKQQIRELFREFSGEGMVAVDEESILEGLIQALLIKGSILIGENQAGTFDDQWIHKKDIIEASRMWIRSDKVKEWVQKYSNDLSPNDLRDFTKKITWYITEYNTMPQQREATKQEFYKINDLKESEFLNDTMYSIFDVLWSPSEKSELKKITIKIFALEVIND